MDKEKSELSKGPKEIIGIDEPTFADEVRAVIPVVQARRNMSGVIRFCAVFGGLDWKNNRSLRFGFQRIKKRYDSKRLQEAGVSEENIHALLSGLSAMKDVLNV